MMNFSSGTSVRGSKLRELMSQVVLLSCSSAASGLDFWIKIIQVLEQPMWLFEVVGCSVVLVSSPTVSFRVAFSLCVCVVVSLCCVVDECLLLWVLLHVVVSCCCVHLIVLLQCFFVPCLIALVVCFVGWWVRLCVCVLRVGCVCVCVCDACCLVCSCCVIRCVACGDLVLLVYSQCLFVVVGRVVFVCVVCWRSLLCVFLCLFRGAVLMCVCLLCVLVCLRRFCYFCCCCCSLWCMLFAALSFSGSTWIPGWFFVMLYPFRDRFEFPDDIFYHFFSDW